MKDHFSFHWPSGITFRKIIFLAVGCVWLAIGLVAYGKLAERTIDRTRSYNAAITETLGADIAGLPRIDSIAPAKTSLNMAYVAQSRGDLSKKIHAGSYDAHPVPIWCRFYPGASRAYKGGSQNQLSLQLADHLYKDSQTIASLRKFVEYMPTIDLANPLDSSATTKEHLARTKQGLLATSRAITDTHLPQSSVIGDALTHLGNNAASLDDASKASWSKDVLKQQEAVLTMLTQSDTQASPYARKLAQISSSYQ